MYSALHPLLHDCVHCAIGDKITRKHHLNISEPRLMTDRLKLPTCAVDLTTRLIELHKNRHDEKEKRKAFQNQRRRSLTKDKRDGAWKKTNGHCHLCGGSLCETTEGELAKERKFAVDHIIPRATGGPDSDENYLPAHRLCNGCRWFYSPEEFQWILRMGVWARKQIEESTPIGVAMREEFWKNEMGVLERRKRHEPN
jgi:5-methylcytosine-specific restriction endonuclease McrA